MLQVIVDRGRCQGSRECVHLAPATFSMDENVMAVVAEPIGDDEATVVEAACSCPNSAIRVLRDGLEVDLFA